MSSQGKLKEFLVDYAASHQHPINVGIHLIGVPTIMLGALIPMTWVSIDAGGAEVSLAHLLLAGFFCFYVTFDVIFALAFLFAGALIAFIAGHIGDWPMPTSGAIAALTFFGGYAAQFIGHAVEKSAPVLTRHPVQANLAAPLFVVIEVFKLLGLRRMLFEEIRRELAERSGQQAN